MWFRLARAAAFAAVACHVTPSVAQTWYWCDPAGGYYPNVAMCPVPWRAVNPATALSRPYTAAPQPSPAGQPTPLITTAPNSFPAHGDGLDDWCKTVTSPRSIALCSDPELRVLAIERQQAFDEARSRLNPTQQKALFADQNGWVKTYPQSCGLSPDAPPTLPLAAAVRDCMAQAGRARIAYLRGYGAPSTAAAVHPTGAAPTPELIWTPEAPRAPQPPIARFPGPAATRDEYLAYVHSLIRQHYNLLPLSMIGGRRGEAEIEFVVLDDGTIGMIKVRQSSGWPDIDARAELMVAAVRRVPPLPKWFQGASMKLILHLPFPDALRAAPAPVALESPPEQQATSAGAPMPELAPAPVQPTPLATATATSGSSCKEDWTKCKDNSDLVNNFHDYVDVKTKCEMEANEEAKYGTPVWPGFWSGGSFTHFHSGTDYVATGVVLAIEPNAQFQNGFGAMVHSTVFCKYDLKSKTVVSVEILPH